MLPIQISPLNPSGNRLKVIWKIWKNHSLSFANFGLLAAKRGRFISTSKCLHHRKSLIMFLFLSKIFGIEKLKKICLSFAINYGPNPPACIKKRNRAKEQKKMRIMVNLLPQKMSGREYGIFSIWIRSWYANQQCLPKLVFFK